MWALSVYFIINFVRKSLWEKIGSFNVFCF